MTIRIRRVLQSFKYAIKGLSYAIVEEQNMKIHVLAAMTVIIMVIVFPVSAMEAVALTLAVGFVITMELANTVLERVMDIIKPRMHPYAKHVKDMLAAMVLVASGCAFIIGLIIFVPKILARF